MKKTLFVILILSFSILGAQTLNIDTLAFQDFEVTPATPTWSFTGPVIYNSGYSIAGAAPPNSPIGIGGSRAWETTVNSTGLILNFANTIIPAGYDSIRVRFNLAAMNLIGASGGPDDLDYVLAAYSTDGGTTYYNRVRIRGAVNNNSFWPYSATGVGEVYYQPATEALFQPITTGLQTTLGFSTVEIVFPGTITQIALRITARSSSSTDTWLVDNLVMTGENVCFNSTSTLSASACGAYTSPSGNVMTSSGTYSDTIPNSTGCDSIITINLTVTPNSSSSQTVSACNSYTLPGGAVVTSSGTYADTLINAAGCDSIITTNLTINGVTTGTLSAQSCSGNYTLPSGAVVTSSGTYMDTIANAAGCDSIITATISVDSSTTAYLSPSVCFSLTLPSGTVVTTSGMYYDTIPNVAGCDSIMTWDVFVYYVDTTITINGWTITSNAVFAGYQWMDCNTGNIIPGEINQSFTPSTNGAYACIVTQGFCTDTTECVVITSVEPVVGLDQIEITPNPVSDKLIIRNCPANSQVTIMDVRGRIIRRIVTTATQTEIDLSDEAKGIYLVEVLTETCVQRSRVVKQ